MRHFTSVHDIPDLRKALDVAFDVRENPFAYSHLGKNKTMVLIFFNSSLRTRLSTQKAAMNLGMNTMVLNVNEDGWKMESELGVVMDGDKPEHLREAIPVIGEYCDIMVSVRLPDLKAKQMITKSVYSISLLNTQECRSSVWKRQPGIHCKVLPI
jgi:N-succinyl-L-ornithine transcarbamylase